MEHVSLSQLVTATGGQTVGFGHAPRGFAAITIDSRKVCPGDLFWAIEGQRHDGHQFLLEAYGRGAAAAVVRESEQSRAGGPAIVVPDTLKALRDFARSYRESRDALIVGVTGSFGKTTTRAMIYAALNAHYSGTQSPQNFNNHVGVPLSILEIEDRHEFAVLEFGASGVGEIRELAEMAAPEIGVITGIGPAHLSGFGSIEHVLSSKFELIESLPESGIAVLPGDNPLLRRLAGRAACRTIFVGEEPGNDVRATNVTAEQNRLSFDVGNDRFELAVTGRHHLTAALCAVAVACEVGIDTATIAAGFRRFSALPGRCQLEQIGPWTVINDTYNANPISMQAACLLLDQWQTTGRKLLVVGDMLELGERSDEFHQQLGRRAANAEIDFLLAFGNEAENVVRGAAEAGMESFELAQCKNFDAVPAILDCWLEPGDVLLVKGSRGMRMERVVGLLWSQVVRDAHTGHPDSSLRAVA